jgi:dolichol-phosphate mannosyltransferase
MISKKPVIAIVIPSYNESRNLNVLLPVVVRSVPRSLIIVIDDSSGREQADTETVCRKNSQHILYVSRNIKSGRGSAVIEGMKLAVARKSVQICVEMDADCAHDPKEIPILLSKIKTSDMVAGSRYLRESRIIHWPLTRLIQSKIINFFLKYWLGLPMTDFTNGFRAYTRKTCEYLISIPLHEKGFISLSEFAYKLKQKGFVIREVPITFTDRKFGKSNADMKELLSCLMGAIRIKFSR